MKKILYIFVLLMLAIAPVQAQADEYVSGDKIEPGMYREIGGLVLSGNSHVQLTPGQERQFRVFSTVTGRAGLLREVVAPATWSVEAVDGVVMDPKGKVTVAPTVPHGTKFKVTAKVTIKEPWEEKGYEETVVQDVLVFHPEQNPLVADWTQKFMTTCKGRKLEVDGSNGLGSIEFRADGTYSAAVAPFEARRDYWGKYEFDLKKGTLKMTVDGGNSDLIYLKTEGRFEVKNGALTISGMQLHPNQQFLKPCKAHFTK